MADKIENTVTLDDVLAMDGPTDSFLCKMSDNVYKIDFMRYKIRDMDSKIVLVDINHADFEDEKTEG